MKKLTYGRPPQEALASEPVKRLLFSMAGPSIIAMLMQAMYNTVDSMYVSRISSGSLAAVTLAFPVQMIMGALSTGIGVGINSCISRNLGAKNIKEASAAAANGLMLGLFTVAIMVAFGLLGSEAFVSLYTDDPEVKAAAVTYVRTICLLGFGSIFSQLSFSVLQGSGSMLFPMISQISGGLIVIILDPILIFTCKMGIYGAAVASSMAQAVSMLIGLYGIFRVNMENLPVTFRGFRPDFAIIRDILAVGVPAAMTQATTSIVAGIVNKEIARFGTTAVSVYGAYSKLSSFATLPVFGVTRGMNPILGYCCGAGNSSRFRETEKLAVITANSWTFICFLMFMFIPRIMLGWMNATPEMYEVGVRSFRLLAISMSFLGASIVMTQVFPPIKKSYISLISALMRQVVFLIPLTMILSGMIGLNGVWIGICLADTLNFVFVIVMNIWLMRKVLPEWKPVAEGETQTAGAAPAKADGK